MIRFSFESAAGVIPLATSRALGGYVFEPGVTGLGLPPELTEWASSPAGGGRLRSRRPGMRDADWPVAMLGDSQDDVVAMADRLAHVIEADAKPHLVARYSDGRAFRLGFFYTSGGEDPVTHWGDSVLQWVLSVRCPFPFWVSEESEQIGPIEAPSEVVGLLPDLAALTVGSSAAFGETTVENTGDVQSPVTWRIEGPGGPTTIDVGDYGFVLDTVLEAGEIVTVAKGPLGWTVVDSTGTNRYADLGPAPKFPSVPRGVSLATIEIADADVGARVTGTFPVLKKLVM